MIRRCVAVLGTAALMAVTVTGVASADTIRVQSTTDTVDAGLVDGLLRDAYAKAHPKDQLQYTAVGTGKALDNARAGLADVVITHAPSLEAQFVADGYSADPFGRQIFYSDYVIVGPKSDPAGVLAKHPHDAVSAFEDIAAAGELGKATFLSRGDNSGTNVQEQVIWGLSNVPKQTASNASGSNQRYEPGAGGTYPAWYAKTNKGQAANAQEADVCQTSTYPNGNCYTMVDRGTFNRLVNGGTVTSLQAVSQNNDAKARGGQSLLINPFSAYVVNPSKFPDGSKSNVAAARRFVDFLVSRDFQAAVAGFPTAVDPAFRPDAFPSLTLAAPLPATANAGKRLTVSGTAANRLPGAPAVSGMPVRVQWSSNGGKTWKNAGPAVKTTAAGSFTSSIRMVRTATFRLSTPAFATSSYNGLSAGTQALSKVSDKTKPRISQIRLSPHELKLKVSEAAIVKVAVERVVTRGRRVERYVAVWRTTFKPKKARTVAERLKQGLAGGHVRIVVRARDASGNTRTVTRKLRLKG